MPQGEFSSPEEKRSGVPGRWEPAGAVSRMLTISLNDVEKGLKLK